ncbi:hypothetical protein [uncultured Kordia sp.]|uniref:hypothetical protein n=1 Tax=uncultured Kordia sp. TaxID=507699 RepID=UPI00262417DF|nr:hypothetical protein [uncultured Kordia sp.]
MLKKNSLEFSTGYTFGVLKNLAFAPVSQYDYTAVHYQFSYTRITKREKLFQVEFNYLNSALESDIIPEPDPEYSKLILNISSLKRIHHKNKLTIHLGLQSQTNVSSYYEWKYYDFQQKFGIAAHFNYKINNKQSLSSKVTIPIILWRTSTFEENFYSLGKYQSVLWNTTYKYALSKHFDVKARYSFNYDRLQIPSAYQELQHQINLGINFNF